MGFDVLQLRPALALDKEKTTDNLHQEWQQQSLPPGLIKSGAALLNKSNNGTSLTPDWQQQSLPSQFIVQDPHQQRDFGVNQNQPQPANDLPPRPDTTVEPKKEDNVLLREWQLIQSLPQGIEKGVLHRLGEIQKNPLVGLGVPLAEGLAIGVGLSLAARNPTALGGLAGVLGRNAGEIGMALMGEDLAVKVGMPMLDTAQHAENLQKNKELLGNNIGSTLIDYPLAVIGGYAGLKWAPGPTAAEFAAGRLAAEELKATRVAEAAKLTELLRVKPNDEALFGSDTTKKLEPYLDTGEKVIEIRNNENLLARIFHTPQSAVQMKFELYKWKNPLNPDGPLVELPAARAPKPESRESWMDDRVVMQIFKDAEESKQIVHIRIPEPFGQADVSIKRDGDEFRMLLDQYVRGGTEDPIHQQPTELGRASDIRVLLDMLTEKIPPYEKDGVLYGFRVPHADIGFSDGGWEPPRSASDGGSGGPGGDSPGPAGDAAGRVDSPSEPAQAGASGDEGESP